MKANNPHAGFTLVEALVVTMICPYDIRQPATNFVIKGSPEDNGNGDFKGNCNASYFVGVAVSDSYSQAILSSDRNLSPGSAPRNDYGFSPANNSGNDVTLRTNFPVCWSLKMHSAGKPLGAGNVLIADGSVLQVSSARFASDYQANAGVPSLEDQTNPHSQSRPPSPSFRLIFP